eukprot:Tbor_TRINITY_DN3529_c0_g1::TRINITY_DN3529_c0_g1_i1::g.2915::m.2915/K15109/SLC25A20_29, CACT, CACL, CRC1; solute carrier family 25 (mitochondrial carnitine/acylcarnitine transporter), member 20/29
MPPSATVCNNTTDYNTTSSLTVTTGVKDYICGTCSGLGKILVGYPFDTVKGRVQTGKFPSVWRAVVDTVRYEGPMTMYQGVTMPTINVCFIGGIMFYINGLIRGIVQPDPIEPLTYGQMLIAGSGAGLVVGCFAAPLEVVKLRMQILNKNDIISHMEKSPSTCKGVHRWMGPSMSMVVKGMRPVDFYSGFTPTLIRESGTFGIFFPVGEFLKRKLTKLKDGIDLEMEIYSQAAERRALQRQYSTSTSNTSYGSSSTDTSSTRTSFTSLTEVPLSTRIIAAGTAGVICWIPLYPIDQIKSKMQIYPAFYYKTMWHAAIDIYRQEGILRGFFKGIEPTLVRAFPAYALQFLIYEKLIAAWP